MLEREIGIQKFGLREMESGGGDLQTLSSENLSLPLLYPPFGLLSVRPPHGGVRGGLALGSRPV